MYSLSPRKVFKELLLTDVYILKSTILDQVINLSIWVTANVLVMGYLMPSFGLSSGYAVFNLAALCASAGLFGVFPSVVNMVDDFEGKRIIDFYLTLPLPSKLIFVRSIIYYALNFSLLGILVLPLGQILLWDRFSLLQVDWFKFAIIFVLIHLFYGAFTLWIASRVKSLLKIGNVWMRFVFPLWFLGCFQFSWSVLYSNKPFLGIIALFNPITYAMEGIRVTVLGQEGYLNFWLCCGMLLFFFLLCSWRSIVRLQKRLDFV